MSGINLDYEKLAKEMLKHFPGSTTSITLIEFTEQVIAYSESNRAEKTVEGIRLVCKKLLKYFAPNRKIDTIQLRDVEKFLDDVKKTASKGVYNYHRVLRSMWNKAKEWNYVRENPFEKVKLKKRQTMKPVYVTEEILEMLKDHLKPEVVRDVVVTAFYSGCRLGELVNLTWKDVDFKNDLLNIGNENYQTKGRKVRPVPIHPRVKEILRSKVKSKKSKDGEHTIVRLPDKDAYVFGKGGRFKFTGDYFSKKFKLACRCAGIDENIHFHCLRHGAATKMIMGGAPLPAVQKILGHANIQTTMVYTHPDLESLRDAVGRL